MKISLSVVVTAMCTLVVAASPLAATSQPQKFVGSEKCKSCHAEEYKSWKGTFHAKMVQPKKSGILKDAVGKWQTDGTNPGPTKGNVTGTSHKLDDVQYVVGSKWKQRYLVKNDQTGNLQFMDKQFNRLSGKWENYGQKNDWNTQCATCHTTGYRITAYDDKANKTLKSEYAELNVGCEACHGPGSRHISAKKADRKKTIINPAGMDVQAQSKVCGYCHVRVETEKWHTAQGNPREDMPAPNLGESYIAGQDWTKWEGVIIPGVQPDQPFTKEYTGDFKGMFKVDEHSKANGIYEEGKHHQQYQGFIQSAHFKKGAMSCITCHSPHAGKGKLRKVPRDACKACHPNGEYTVEKHMPNTGQTAGGLFVRTHTFGKNPRPSGKGASDMGPPNYYE
ncbi:MAG: multiheme c-type cytochrome [Desulfuromonadaceae bacterium]